jgi:hypothetical protein
MRDKDRPKAPASYALLRKLNQRRCLELWTCGIPRKRIAEYLGVTLDTVCTR